MLSLQQGVHLANPRIQAVVNLDEALEFGPCISGVAEFNASSERSVVKTTAISHDQATARELLRQEQNTRVS